MLFNIINKSIGLGKSISRFFPRPRNNYLKSIDKRRQDLHNDYPNFVETCQVLHIGGSTLMLASAISIYGYSEVDSALKYDLISDNEVVVRNRADFLNNFSHSIKNLSNLYIKALYNEGIIMKSESNCSEKSFVDIKILIKKKIIDKHLLYMFLAKNNFHTGNITFIESNLLDSLWIDSFINVLNEISDRKSTL